MNGSALENSGSQTPTSHNRSGSYQAGLLK